MKTGMQFTIAQPAAMTCSAYHLVASSEPTGQVVDDDVDLAVLEDADDVVGRPAAFSTISERYLPRPSSVMPRETVMPVFSTSANLIVSFGCAQIASARSTPTLPLTTSNAATTSTSRMW